MQAYKKKHEKSEKIVTFCRNTHFNDSGESREMYCYGPLLTLAQMDYFLGGWSVSGNNKYGHPV